jgi:phosphoketolase
MIFLRDNALCERKLTHDDIKNRLLGHWGTCPGLSIVYTHLNRLINKFDLDMLFVVGPGKYDPLLLLPTSYELLLITSYLMLRSWCTWHFGLSLA